MDQNAKNEIKEVGGASANVVKKIKQLTLHSYRTFQKSLLMKLMLL